jgi:hypothetical protein
VIEQRKRMEQVESELSRLLSLCAGLGDCQILKELEPPCQGCFFPPSRF